MNNVYEFQDQKSIEEEAATWLIKLDGDESPSAHELQMFREWLARSDSHTKIFQRYSTFWTNEAVLAELAIPLKPLGKHSVFSRSFWGRSFKSFQGLAGAGALACTLVITVMVSQSDFNSVNEQGHVSNVAYQTTVGEQRAHTLADGSVVLLNTNTELKVVYTEQRRKIILLKGEAHFDVESQPNRPFEVYAGSGMVRAVGTAFSVYLSEDNIEVLVSEGKVDLTDIVSEPLIKQGARLVGMSVAANEPERLGSLEAGQSAVFQSGKINYLQTLQAPELERQQSWRSGVLTFVGEPLSQVVAEINRYTLMRVEIIDPTLKDIEVGGRFKVADIGGVFDVLEAEFGIQVSRLSGDRVQLHRAAGQ